MDKVCFIVVKARELLSEDEGVRPDASNPSDDCSTITLTDAADRHFMQELREFIDALDATRWTPSSRSPGSGGAILPPNGARRFGIRTEPGDEYSRLSARDGAAAELYRGRAFGLRRLLRRFRRARGNRRSSGDRRPGLSASRATEIVRAGAMHE